MVRRRWLLAVAVLAVLGGCGTDGGARPDGDGPRRDQAVRLRQQADDALARYDQALQRANLKHRFVPIGELGRQVGDWEPANVERKQSLLAGLLQANRQLPVAPQPTAKVVWADGTEQEVPTISADEGLMQLVAAGTGECPDCPPLQVVDARQSTMEIETTRGPATVPAWEYHFDGTAVRVLRMAVASAARVDVAPPAGEGTDAPIGLIIESATTTTITRQLTVSFTGVPGPKSEPCGADYRAEAVESANAVVVIVTADPHKADEVCSAVGATRTTTVELAEPLGERAVLDVQQGMPVPIRITE